MKKHIGIAAVATLALTGAAIAADMPAPVYKAPPPMVAPVYNWSGCYVGAEGGAAWGRSQHRGAQAGTTTTLDITAPYNVNGGLFGGTVGCNFQASSTWVFGLEGDMSWTNKKGQANDIAPFNTTTVSATSEHWLATGRGRLGFALSNPLLLYVTGGFAVASVEAIVTPAAFPAVSESQTRWGWTVGAGGEWGFAPNWSAKLEYLRVELQSGSYFPAGGIVVAPGQTIVHRDNVPLNNNIVRAGINYRF